VGDVVPTEQGKVYRRKTSGHSSPPFLRDDAPAQSSGAPFDLGAPSITSGTYGTWVRRGVLPPHGWGFVRAAGDLRRGSESGGASSVTTPSLFGAGVDPSTQGCSSSARRSSPRFGRNAAEPCSESGTAERSDPACGTQRSRARRAGRRSG